jgi:hypothetical protein
MKYLLAPLFLFAFFVMFGCTPSYRVKTDATNYREKLSIKKMDYEFFIGKYIGPENNCFPPIEYSVCPNYSSDEVYKPTKELKMENFSISISDTSGVTSKVVKDMAYLTAAELAEQRGFKTFTVLNSMETNACSSMYSVNTYGSVTGNTYSGTSYLSKDAICANNYSIYVLFYDESEDLKRGVLFRSPRSRLQPDKSLYIGTTPGLYEEYLEQRVKYPPIGNTTGFIPEKNAWKIHYDIKGLTGELRKLYGILEILPYSFEDERVSNRKSDEKKNAVPIEKFKVIK